MVTASALTTKARRSLVLGPAHQAILEGLLRYYYLTNRQLVRLLAYQPSSLGYLRGLTKSLAEKAFIQPIFLPRPGRLGSAPLVFCLSRKGLNYLAACGREVDRRFRPSEQQHSYLFLAHTRRVNDWLLALANLARHRPELDIAHLLHERQLRRQPAHVQGRAGSRSTVILDAWVELHLTDSRGTRQICWGLEADLASEEQKHWRRKAAGHIAWSKGPYQEQFKTSSLTIVVTTPSPKRLLELLHWTENELKALGEEEEADLYRFTCLSAETTDPVEFFLAATHWYKPFGYRNSPPPSKPALSDYQAVALLTVG